MVAARRSRAADHGEEPGTGETAEYEQIRDQRIRENKERMQKLGIFELTQQLKKSKPASARGPKNPKPPTKSISGSPSRRSSRLKDMAPVSYVEKRSLTGKKGSSWDGEIKIKQGIRPEIYTDEHEKLLGDCKETWELSVDGYGEDRKRIYDAVQGETCHQCRQKTLGQHTHCCKCDLVQGQLCGDCLYMRYGENVIEANQNPKWLCPGCRGICNCSLCRKEKGWEPTGNLYRKVISLGYKSVAHYLIQTRRSQKNSETSDATDPMHSDTKQGVQGHSTKGDEMEEEQDIGTKDVRNMKDAGAGVTNAVNGETNEKLRRSTRRRN